MKLTPLTGSICLAFSLSGFGQAPPPNDNFSNRIVLTGEFVTFGGTLSNATLEANEDLGGNFNQNLGAEVTQSVWWTWTASQTSLVTIEMIGASADTQTNWGSPTDALAIYDTTNIFASTQPVAEMNMDLSILCHTLTFLAITGGNYQIQLLGSSSAAYQFMLMATNSPLILQQPRSVTISSNASTLFTVVAEGYRPLSYQWQFDGTNLRGQTAPMLALTNIDTSQAGSYAVIVTNTGGTVTSAPVILAVSSADVSPIITALPGQPGRFSFGLNGEIGRNYRIESTIDLAEWVNENSFQQTAITMNGADFYSTPFFTSVVFNTNGSSVFSLSNNLAFKFLRASQYQPANEICINNLRAIRFAKSLWLRDKELPNRILTPVDSDLSPYFAQGHLPVCPLDPDRLFGTSYNPNDCQSAPQCVIEWGIHILEEPQ